MKQKAMPQATSYNKKTFYFHGEAKKIQTIVACCATPHTLKT
jgi:hypothetical protein